MIFKNLKATDSRLFTNGTLSKKILYTIYDYPGVDSLEIKRLLELNMQGWCVLDSEKIKKTLLLNVNYVKFVKLTLFSKTNILNIFNKFNNLTKQKNINNNKKYEKNVIYVTLSRLIKHNKIIKNNTTKLSLLYLETLTQEEIKKEITVDKQKEIETEELRTNYQKKKIEIGDQMQFWEDYIKDFYLQGNEFFIDYEELMKPKYDHEQIELFIKDPEEGMEIIRIMFEKTYNKPDIKIGVKGKKKGELIPLKNLRRSVKGLFFAESEIDFKTDVQLARKSTTYECYSCTETKKLLNSEVLKEKFPSPGACVCGSRQWREIDHEFIEYQKILLRDLDVNLLPGEQPTQKNALIRHALINPKHERNLHIGDKIQVTGYLKQYLEKSNDAQANQYIEVLGIEYLDKINYEEKFSEEEIKSFKDLKNDKNALQIFCNSLFYNHNGDDLAKLFAALQLFGGFQTSAGRGSINILLFGEPGTGKTSNFLGNIKKVFPRTSYITAGNNTKAALGVSSAKNEFIGRNISELGAVPRANKGYLLIDEINDIDSDMFDSMIQAMESGYVTVNKTGARGDFPADIRVLASMNPKTDNNCFTPGLQFFDQPTGLRGKFLDRFDFVLPFVDRSSIESVFNGRNHSAYLSIPTYDFGWLRRYVLYAEQFDPVFTDDLYVAFIKIFLGLTRRDLVRQAKYRVVRKCENLVKCVARFFLSDVITRDHLFIASQIYLRYGDLVDNFLSGEGLYSFEDLLPKNTKNTESIK